MIGADSPYEHEIVVEGDDRAEASEVHERADVGRRSVDGERLNSHAENGGCQAPDNCRTFMFRRRIHSHTAAMQRLDKSLNGIGIFEGISHDAQRTLAKRCSWNTYDANQQIVGHLDTSRQVFFLAEGKARAIIYSLSGKQVTFRDIVAGEMFGEFAAIDGKPRSARVEAFTPCLIASMSPELFWEVLCDYPPVMAATLEYLTGQIRTLSERVFEFSTLAVKNRIHAELLRLARDHLNEDGTAFLSPVPTHAEIASRISTHREAVTRELNHLAHTGLIERREGKLIIHDIPRLTRMVQELIGE